MKTKYTTTTSRDIYTELERITDTVIRHKQSRQYTPLLEELRKAAANDRTARNAPQIAAEIDEREKANEDTLKAADHFRRIAKRLTATAEERAAALDMVRELTAKAANERKSIDTLQAALDVTFSDRAAIPHEIWIATQGAPTDKERAAAEQYAQSRADKYAEQRAKTNRTPWLYLNAAESARVFIAQDSDTIAAIIDEDAQRRHNQNGGSRYIYNMRGVNAMDTTHTDSVPADDDTCQAWIDMGHKLGADYKYTTDSATISIEYRENDERGAGWYKVTRRRTIKQGNSYEDLTEDGESIGIKHTRNTYAENLANVEQIHALTQRANLTDRERRFLYEFCTANARAAESDGRRAYLDSQAAAKVRDKSRRNAAANRIGYAARLAHCFGVIDIKTDEAQRQFTSRLRRRLKAADTRTTDSGADFTPNDFDYYKHITESNHGTAYADRDQRADIVGVILENATHRERTATALILHRVERGGVWTYRTAKSAADSAAAILAAEERAANFAKCKSRIDNTTDTARERATKAAATYAAKVAEQTARARAAAIAELEQQQTDSREKWRTEYAARKPYYITAAEFNRVQGDSRVKWLEEITAKGYRVEFKR